MTELFELPRLYGEGSKGTTKEWEISVVPVMSPDGDYGEIHTEYGSTGARMQTTVKVIKEGKNIGKANETTPFEQACKEAQSAWTKKKKKGYRESIEDLRNMVTAADMTSKGASGIESGKAILPMLAHPFNKRKHNIVWPAFAQAKIDGHRAYGTDGALLSRGGDPVPSLPNLPHIQRDLDRLAKLLPDGTWYDGELYTNDLPFEELGGHIRRAKLKQEAMEYLPLIKFYVFDLFNPKDLSWTFEDRFNLLAAQWDSWKLKNIILVPINLVHNEEELRAFHDMCVQAGYEGAVIRNALGTYAIGHHSADTQKFKEFQDDEFPIIDFKEGTGKDAGTVIWVCNTKVKGSAGGVEVVPHFDVRPVGSHEYRARLFQDGESFIGKNLTVRYQNLTEYGIPRFPVGRAIREKGE